MLMTRADLKSVYHMIDGRHLLHACDTIYAKLDDPIKDLTWSEMYIKISPNLEFRFEITQMIINQ